MKYHGDLSPTTPDGTDRPSSKWNLNAENGPYCLLTRQVKDRYLDRGPRSRPFAAIFGHLFDRGTIWLAIVGQALGALGWRWARECRNPDMGGFGDPLP
jgi:hypothetical protein